MSGVNRQRKSTTYVGLTTKLSCLACHVVTTPDHVVRIDGVPLVKQLAPHARMHPPSHHPSSRAHYMRVAYGTNSLQCIPLTTTSSSAFPPERTIHLRSTSVTIPSSLGVDLRCDPATKVPAQVRHLCLPSPQQPLFEHTFSSNLSTFSSNRPPHPFTAISGFLTPHATMDEAIEFFTSISGAGPDVARRYLALTDNVVEQAVQLYFDSPDLATGAEQESQPPPPPIPSSTRPRSQAGGDGASSARRTHTVDSDDEDLLDTDYNDDDGHSRAAAVGRAAEIEDDAAMARRLQEEMYAGGDAGGGVDADGVRAPIGRTTETLVGGPLDDYDHVDGHAVALAQMRRMQGRACMV